MQNLPKKLHKLTKTMASEGFSVASTIKLNNGILMPRIHLGVYMTSGRETSTAVSHALSAGYRAIDSAEWYANEKEVGSAILSYLKAEKEVTREDIWFTTKLKSNVSYDDTRKKIKRSIKESGLGYLDLYLLHSPYGGKTRRLECWRAVEDAIDAGEVRAGGVSNYGVKHVCPSSSISSTFISLFLLTVCVAARVTILKPTHPTSYQPNRSPPLQHPHGYNLLLRRS